MTKGGGNRQRVIFYSQSLIILSEQSKSHCLYCKFPILDSEGKSANLSPRQTVKKGEREVGEGRKLTIKSPLPPSYFTAPLLLSFGSGSVEEPAIEAQTETRNKSVLPRKMIKEMASPPTLLFLTASH